jgi:hypothetical protein
MHDDGVRMLPAVISLAVLALLARRGRARARGDDAAR